MVKLPLSCKKIQTPACADTRTVHQPDDLNPLDLKEPDVGVVPDWRIHIAVDRKKKETRQSRSPPLLGRFKVQRLFSQAGVLPK